MRAIVACFADVKKNFRENRMIGYDLDPVHFVSAPHMTWNALLKPTKEHIDLISNPEIYRMIQQNVRGGICNCSVGYARAKNKYMGTL